MDLLSIVLSRLRKSRVLYLVLSAIVLMQLVLLVAVNNIKLSGNKAINVLEPVSNGNVMNVTRIVKSAPTQHFMKTNVGKIRPTLARVNITDEEINEYPWKPETKRKYLLYLRPFLFSEELGPESDSICPIPKVPPPKDLCSRNVQWRCNFSPTFVHHDREKRKLFVNCSDVFRINFIDHEESEKPSSNGKFVKSPEWVEYIGPHMLDFNTSQFADVECKFKEDGRVVAISHNYRTQFLPNNRSQEQKNILEGIKSQEENFDPVSVLSFSLDSVSRAHFHRKCGLPKTAELIHKLYLQECTGFADDRCSHQAFLFNRVNSISGITAMNLYPLYAGEYFSRIDEEERVLRHSLRSVKEWMWDYANQRGYLTSYGIDTGNGLMGTRTTCKTCTNRPGVLPHFDHLWVARENSPLVVEPEREVWSGLCEGDSMLHDYILNYTRDFLEYDYPAKWAAFDLNAQHRPEHESINQVDDSLVSFLEAVMRENPNLFIFMFGDHGQIYQGPASKHLGSHLEVLLPFFSIIIPKTLIFANPQWERNLLLNSRRYVVFYDVHRTMKSLFHYPFLNRTSGHFHHNSYNLLTDVIPKNRTCSDAGLPSWTCVCNMPIILPNHSWTQEHYRFVDTAISEINLKHSMEVLIHHGRSNTTCRDITLNDIVNIVVYKHGNNPKGNEMNQYAITFSAIEGPSLWQLIVDAQGIINSIKQTSRYQKYEECQDPLVSIEFCICKQFPPGTP
ncbi:uncharacterized protein LOC144342819 [Saccoglossus kowalevskii]